METNKTPAAYKQELAQSLAAIYGSREASVIARILIEEILGKETDMRQEMSGTAQAHLDTLKYRLLNMEPLQYVLGYAWFLAYELLVDQTVLIPRPETEELVALVLDLVKMKNPTILDVGTGSGAIAIALKKEIPRAIVYACDVSPEALKVARLNAEKYQAPIHWITADALSASHWEAFPRLDVLVSNPPYIPNSEKAEMLANVLHWEPALALFVEDDSPLIFYERILQYGSEKMNPGGQVFLEIHPRFAEELISMTISFGWLEVVVLPDLQGNMRMLHAQWPEI